MSTSSASTAMKARNERIAQGLTPTITDAVYLARFQRLARQAVATARKVAA